MQLRKINSNDRHLVVHAQRKRRRSHHLQLPLQRVQPMEVMEGWFDKYDICRIADYAVVLQDLNIPIKPLN